MPAAKLVVIYPVPTDLEKFERLILISTCLWPLLSWRARPRSWRRTC
jgi:hypothetical protein